MEHGNEHKMNKGFLFSCVYVFDGKQIGKMSFVLRFLGHECTAHTVDLYHSVSLKVCLCVERVSIAVLLFL